MPRGERQTTGTAQALLGAKQIAAQERASKRATVADYVKTGVGALKGVGDYLQKKQALEQNQEKLNLEQSLFSAQFGDEGEQGRKRQQEEKLRLTSIGLAEAQTKVAKGAADADIAARQALAAKAGSEAKMAELDVEFAEGTLENKIAMSALDLKGREHEVGSAGEKRKILKIQRQFAKLREKGEIDRILKLTESLDQQIKASISGEERDDRRLVLEGRRVVVEEERADALLDDLLDKRELTREQFNFEKKKYKEQTDPEKREAMLSEWDKKRRDAELKKVKADTKEGLSRSALLETQRKKEADKAAAGLGDLQVESRDQEMVYLNQLASMIPKGFQDDVKKGHADLAANNLNGPNADYIRQVHHLIKDGVVESASKLSANNYNQLAEEGSLWSTTMTGTMEGTTLVHELGTQFYHLTPDNRARFMQSLAREWPEGIQKMEALADQRDPDTVGGWFRSNVGNFGVFPVIKAAAYGLGGPEFTRQGEYHAESMFFRGIAGGMRAAAAGEPPMDNPAYKELMQFDMTPGRMQALGMKNPADRVVRLPGE